MSRVVRILQWYHQWGVGQDTAILKEVVEAGGYQPIVANLRSTDRQPVDINIFLAFNTPDVDGFESLLASARINILIPNREWIVEEQLSLLKRFDLILAKTRECELFCQELGLPVMYSSFTSFDRYRPEVERVDEALHLVGRSIQKGTDHLVELYQREGESLPHLHLHCEPFLVAERHIDLFTVPNMTKTCVFHRPEEEIIELQNRHKYHLCPSFYEGFGHYINEAKSVGAIIVTTDGPPMNELIRPEFGLLVPPATQWQMGIAVCNEVSADTLAPVMHQLASAPTEMGALARQDFLRNDAFFRQRLLEILREI